MQFVELSVKTTSRVQFVDITHQIEKIIKTSKVSEGLCHVFIPHTTAAVTINESADPDVPYDIIHKLNQLIPENDKYNHFEGNSDAHIKTTLVGTSETIAVKNNRLVLGRWQGIFLCEFDGPRTRKVQISVVEG